MQNTSHAVMAQRSEPRDSPDDFPTPPWATRSLMEYVLTDAYREMSCLEPACGAGHMAKVLREYFDQVSASDIYDYGYGSIADFMASEIAPNTFDWVITNPPFKLAEPFVIKALDIAKVGVAILARTVFIESIGRYTRLFERTPPAQFAQFVERVPMVKGRLDPKASTATGYAWIVWRKSRQIRPELVWIPPCRKKLERPDDYSATKHLVVHKIEKSILSDYSQKLLF